MITSPAGALAFASARDVFPSPVLFLPDVVRRPPQFRLEMPNGGINALQPLENGLVLTHHSNFALSAVEVASGRVVWQTRTGANQGSVYEPRTSRDTVVAASTSVGVVMYRVP